MKKSANKKLLDFILSNEDLLDEIAKDDTGVVLEGYLNLANPKYGASLTKKEVQQRIKLLEVDKNSIYDNHKDRNKVLLNWILNKPESLDKVKGKSVNFLNDYVNAFNYRFGTTLTGEELYRALQHEKFTQIGNLKAISKEDARELTNLLGKEKSEQLKGSQKGVKRIWKIVYWIFLLSLLIGIFSKLSEVSELKLESLRDWIIYSGITVLSVTIILYVSRFFHRLLKIVGKSLSVLLTGLLLMQALSLGCSIRGKLDNNKVLYFYDQRQFNDFVDNRDLSYSDKSSLIKTQEYYCEGLLDGSYRGYHDLSISHWKAFKSVKYFMIVLAAILFIIISMTEYYRFRNNLVKKNMTGT